MPEIPSQAPKEQARSILMDTYHRRNENELQNIPVTDSLAWLGEAYDVLYSGKSEDGDKELLDAINEVLKENGLRPLFAKAKELVPISQEKSGLIPSMKMLLKRGINYHKNHRNFINQREDFAQKINQLETKTRDEMSDIAPLVVGYEVDSSLIGKIETAAKQADILAPILQEAISVIGDIEVASDEVVNNFLVAEAENDNKVIQRLLAQQIAAKTSFGQVFKTSSGAAYAEALVQHQPILQVLDNDHSLDLDYSTLPIIAGQSSHQFRKSRESRQERVDNILGNENFRSHCFQTLIEHGLYEADLPDQLANCTLWQTTIRRVVALEGQTGISADERYTLYASTLQDLLDKGIPPTVIDDLASGKMNSNDLAGMMIFDWIRRVPTPNEQTQSQMDAKMEAEYKAVMARRIKIVLAITGPIIAGTAIYLWLSQTDPQFLNHLLQSAKDLFATSSNLPKPEPTSVPTIVNTPNPINPVSTSTPISTIAPQATEAVARVADNVQNTGQDNSIFDTLSNINLNEPWWKYIAEAGAGIALRKLLIKMGVPVPGIPLPLPRFMTESKLLEKIFGGRGGGGANTEMGNPFENDESGMENNTPVMKIEGFYPRDEPILLRMRSSDYYNPRTTRWGSSLRTALFNQSTSDNQLEDNQVGYVEYVSRPSHKGSYYYPVPYGHGIADHNTSLIDRKVDGSWCIDYQEKKGYGDRKTDLKYARKAKKPYISYNKTRQSDIEMYPFEDLDRARIKIIENVSVLPAEVRDLLTQVDSYDNDLDKANALADYVRNQFTYSLSPKNNTVYNRARTQGPDKFWETLFTFKKVKCDGAATATIALLRQKGIPCRHVVGYAAIPGEEYVRSKHAHGWIECLINGELVVIDPTPSNVDAETEKIFKRSNFWAKFTHFLSLPEIYKEEQYYRDRSLLFQNLNTLADFNFPHSQGAVTIDPADKLDYYDTPIFRRNRLGRRLKAVNKVLGDVVASQETGIDCQTVQELVTTIDELEIKSENLTNLEMLDNNLLYMLGQSVINMFNEIFGETNTVPWEAFYRKYGQDFRWAEKDMPLFDDPNIRWERCIRDLHTAVTRDNFNPEDLSKTIHKILVKSLFRRHTNAFSREKNQYQSAIEEVEAKYAPQITESLISQNLIIGIIENYQKLKKQMKADTAASV